MPSRILTTTWEFLLDVVYPPRCGGCGRRGTLFCEECMQAVDPPDEVDTLPGIDLYIAAGAFSGPLREAIHTLKYEGDTPLARPLARILWGAIEHEARCEPLLACPPVIVPVPLHIRRERERGFNQSALLARELSRLSGWSVVNGLVRTRQTGTQVGLHASERQENVRGAFAWAGTPAPERVLLLDDVCTTGSTLSEGATALRAAGVKQVFAATVGRAAGHDPAAGS